MDGQTRDLSEEIRQRERLYEDVRRALEGVLLANRSRARLLFATAAAQRIFARRDELPADEREPYSEVWRPTLEALWAYAAGAHSQFYAISAALGRYYLSPQHHNEGQDGPQEGDTEEVAATYYAVNCALHNLTEFAVLAAERAFDFIDFAYAEDEERCMTEFDRELRLQRENLAAICDAAQHRWPTGPPPELLRALRAR